MKTGGANPVLRHSRPKGEDDETNTQDPGSSQTRARLLVRDEEGEGSAMTKGKAVDFIPSHGHGRGWLRRTEGKPKSGEGCLGTAPSSACSGSKNLRIHLLP